MREQELCVVHVAAVEDRQALEALALTTPVIATLGVGLQERRGADAAWTSAIAAEVRSLRCSGLSVVRRIRALQSEFARLREQKVIYAVHLHGIGPCLLGLRALKGSALQGRVLYSPHGRHFSWAAGLLGPLLQSQLSPFNYAPLAASLTEAEELSKLLNRSAEVLPYPVGEAFFALSRLEDARPSILARGCGDQALAMVTRLCVLLNSRDARVRFSWLGMAEGPTRVQLEAAHVHVLDAADDRETAQALRGAWLFLEIALCDQRPLGVPEAMAAGVPCLVSDIPAHRALVHHGETGFVCTSERDFLEKAVLLLRDRAERRRIGEAARCEAERRFTLRHFESAILRAYGFSGSDLVRADRAALLATSPQG
jgi:glycosyltransferase involved in cell wall biosynthesis